VNILRVSLLVLVSFSYSLKSADVWFDYTRDGKAAVAGLHKKAFFLDKVQVQSDISFSEDECLSIIGLRERQFINKVDLERACFYLLQSGRFASIRFALKAGKKGKVVCFKLKAHCLFVRLAIDGILLGKDQLKQRYLLHPGEPFSLNEHNRSLKSYRSYFRKRGYLNVSIRDELIRSEKNKTVKVRIHIHKGRRFSIKNVELTLNSFSGENLDSVQKLLQQYATKRLKHRIYKAVVVNDVSRTLKYMLLQKGFPIATMRMRETCMKCGGIRLVLNIEIPQKSRFIITGNKLFSYEQLIMHIVRDQTLLWHLSTPFLINTLRQWYKRHGFLKSSVSVEHTEKGWEIAIDEGARIKLSEVVFEGVSAFDTNVLKDFFRSILGTDYVDDEDLKNAIEALFDFYVKQGFWDAELEERTFVVDGQAHLLRLSINEGVQRFLDRVVVDGDLPTVYKTELEKQLQPNVLPISFDLYLFDKHKDRIVEFLERKEMRANILPTFDETSNNIVLRWQIEKRASKSVFGNTIIKGIPEIGSARIIRELAYKSGDVWDKKLLDRTFKNLRDLNIFESIRIYPLTKCDPHGQRPIIVDLVADDPLQVQARVGFVAGNKLRSNTYKVGGSILYKNITHHADTFSFDADVTRFWRDIELHYTYPHIGGLRLSLDAKLFSKKYDQLCYTGCKTKLYTTSGIGGAIDFHAQFNYFIADFSGGLEVAKITNLFEKGAQAMNFAPYLVGCREPYLFFSPQVVLEYVDDTSNPRCGIISRCCAKFMFPLDNKGSRLVRLLFEQSFFLPFCSLLVGAIRARIGHIFTPSFYRLLPSERFYLGGPCSIRSYQQDFAPPVSCYYDGGICNWVPEGSCSMASINTELRYFATKKFGGVLFYDGGLLRDERKKHYCWSHGLGLGIRYITPIGPMRFDIGWKGKYFAAERSSLTWFLTIGHAF